MTKPAVIDAFNNPDTLKAAPILFPAYDPSCTYTIARDARQNFLRESPLPLSCTLALASWNLNDAKTINFKRREFNTHEYTIEVVSEAASIWDKDEFAWLGVYNLDFPDKKLHFARADNDGHKRGIGRHFGGLGVAIALACKFEKVTVHAQNVGAHSWAAAAFYADNPDRLRDDLALRIAPLRRYKTFDLEEPIEEAVRLSQSAEPGDLMRLARMPQRITLDKPDYRLGNKRHVQMIAKPDTNGQPTITVGQYFLLNQKYDAHIDLASEDQIKHLGDYSRVPIRALAAAAVIPPTRPARRSLIPVVQMARQP